eukprot:TRINITY_DN13616_c0_g1_i1.p1 TRINITY_DN13616_c0_g1~~TRINITY_DN13616_c0_g1_i1.p1  ORF type:complete len:851 (-),score=303.72 TRINITY_DN13616_c0_g1_i1:316-2868(-)
MLSTMRYGRAPARTLASAVERRQALSVLTRAVARRGAGAAEGELALLARNAAPQRALTQSGAGGLRFCSGGKTPPRGFEKFYKKSTPKKAEAAEGSKPAEGAKKEGAPSEQQQGGSQKAETSGPKSESTGKKGEGPSEGKAPKGNKGDKKGEKGSETQAQYRNSVVLAAAVATLFALTYGSGEQPQDEITIQEMMKEFLIKGHVEKIQIVNKSSCRVHLRHDAPGNHAGQTLNIQLGTPEAFEAKLEHLQNELGLSPLDHVPIQYVTETDAMAELLPHLPSLLILIPLFFAARAMSSGMGAGPGAGGPGGRNIFSIGKAFPAGQKDVKSKTKFADVAGLHGAKQEVVEFVDFLRDPQKYAALGARVPKGGLLVGPPGTGKTLLAKAVAGEADVPFYSMSGSDFIEMFVGVGPSRVRDLFQQARSTAPSIIFIDEIDAVGRKRGKGGFSGGGNDERENTLNQLLVEMDGFATGTGVVVLAGTNRVDILDPALTRPGRFDRQIAIDKPDLNERADIFMVHLKPIKLAEGLSANSVAKRMAALTPGFSGSDIANICNESAIFAARRNSAQVEMEDFERATERVMGGLPKHNNLMSAEDKRAVALHEAGHAIVGWFLEHADPLLKVSIVPRSSGALGFAQYLPEEMSLYSKEAILDKIAVSLGGRAAEEIFVGRISTGASDDLDKVTKMAYSMVAVYGMNPELGLLSYNQNNASEQFYKPYSEETGQLIDREARQIVEIQYARVKELLKEKKDLMMAMGDKLAEKETLVYTDLRELLGERPFQMKQQYGSFITASGEAPAEEAAAEAADAAKAPAGDDAAKAAPAAAEDGAAKAPEAAAAKDSSKDDSAPKATA